MTESVGTVTFLFTDIEESTRLVRDLRDAYADVLDEHRRLLREVVRRHGGEEVDTQGDSFFFTFRRARDCLLAAAEAQRALATHVWPEGGSVRVRMGVHTGEPGRSGTGYHGVGVVRAARISAAAHGAQVLVSDATRALVDDDELPGMEFRDLGEHRLKGLERAQRLWQLVIAGLPSQFPPLRGVDSEQVAADSRRRRRRLVLVGTVVALAIAAAIAAYFATRGGSAAPAVAQHNSVAVIDPADNRLVDDLPVGDRPTRIVAGDGSIWALNEQARTVSQIDPGSHNVRTFAIGVVPDDIAVGAGKLWVGESRTGTLDEIDPGSGTTLRTVRPKFPRGVGPFRASLSDAGNVAFGGGDVWFAGGRGTLARIDAHTLHVRRVVTDLDSSTDGQVVALPGAVWMHDDNGIVSHVDPATNRRVGRVNIYLHTTGGVAVTPDGNAWVTDTSQDVIWELDGQLNSIVKSFPVGTNPFGVAYGAGALWIANNGDGTVTRLDPATRHTTTIPVGAGPLRVAFAFGKVWVTVD